MPAAPAEASPSHLHPPVPADSPAGLPAAAPDSDAEENIYEVMKQHMARKKEELDAQNAQFRQNRSGRPGPAPASGAPAAPVAPRPVEKVANLTDFAAVWTAARAYLAQHARILESVLGNCTQVAALNATAAEITLAIYSTQRHFTNERARAKLEEALRAVTDHPLKLTVDFIDPPKGSAAGGAAAGPNGPDVPLAAAQRVPPEMMEALKKQPLIRELMKKLDATVTQVEILESAPAESSAES